MSDGEAAAGNVEPIPVPPRPRIVSAELDRIVDESRRHRVTLLYGSRDPRINHAVVLLHHLHGRLNARVRRQG